MRILHLIPFVFPLAALAGPVPLPPLACVGLGPDWRLEILSENSARLRYDGRDTLFEIPQTTTAEGPDALRDWPRAMTLMARNDTAILVLDQVACTLEDDSYPLALQVLTQRGTSPILLTGCCQIIE